MFDTDIFKVVSKPLKYCFVYIVQLLATLTCDLSDDTGDVLAVLAEGDEGLLLPVGGQVDGEHVGATLQYSWYTVHYTVIMTQRKQNSARSSFFYFYPNLMIIFSSKLYSALNYRQPIILAQPYSSR